MLCTLVSVSAITHFHMVQEVVLIGTKSLITFLKYLHWQPFCFRIHFKIIVLVFKSLNGDAPFYLYELLHHYITAHSLRSGDQLLLTVPSTRCKLRGDQAFGVMEPKLWNKLPLHIRQAFKSLLKTNFYSWATCCVDFYGFIILF